jgi:IS5 family transposase
MGRNFYKEIIGANINILLAAAAFNFKRMMNKWKSSICQILNVFLAAIFFI